MIEFYFSAAEFSAILHFSLWIAFLLHCLPNRIIISNITFSISTAPTPSTACSRLQTVVGYSFDFTTPESRIVFILVLGHTIITSSPICKILSSLVCSNLDLVSLYSLSPFCSFVDDIAVWSGDLPCYCRIYGVVQVVLFFIRKICLRLS